MHSNLQNHVRAMHIMPNPEVLTYCFNIPIQENESIEMPQVQGYPGLHNNQL